MTQNSDTIQTKTVQDFCRSDFLSRIKGEITMFLPHEDMQNVYYAKPLGVDNTRILINLPRRMAGHGFLRQSATVVVNFIVDNVLYEAVAEYRAEHKRVREIIISSDIKQASRRRFERHPLEIKAGYCPVSDISIKAGRLDKMSWMNGNVCELSGGGALIETRLPAPFGSYLLLNMELTGYSTSLQMFGQVRWSGISEIKGNIYHCGIMFLTTEDLPHHFSPQSMSVIPGFLKDFTRKNQMELDAWLTRAAANMHKGVTNDDSQNIG